MKIEQRKDGTFIATERRDGVLHVCQGSTQDKAYYALCYKLDQLFSSKCDAMIDAATSKGEA